MSELTNALEKISRWIANSNSTHAQMIRNSYNQFYSLNPGLEKEIIDLYAEEMNLELSPEIYELYQWHDGRFEIGDYANPVFFPTLDEVLDCLKNCKYVRFPILFGDDCYYAMDIEQNKVLSAIRLYDHPYIAKENIISGYYAPNLTSLMKAVAECAVKHDVISLYLADNKNLDDKQYREKSLSISEIYKKHGITGDICGLWR